MIIATVKDTGGMEAILPVVQKLREQGHEVRLVANDVSVPELRKKGLDFLEASTAQEVLDRFSFPKCLLTSMCSQGGPGRDLIPLLRGEVPTVVIQDQWGVLAEWHREEYCPDYVVVNDSVGAELVYRAWPLKDTNRVRILGFSALDAFFGFNRPQAFSATRARLGIAPDEPVASFFGQLSPTGVAIEELAEAWLRLPPGRRTLLVGMHPRFKVDNPELSEDARLMENALARIAATDTRVIRLSAVAGERLLPIEVIAASNVSLAMFSTTLMHAAALRIPGIAILYPDSPMRERFKTERGGFIDEHPLVTLGAIAGPCNRDELVQNLRRAFSGELEQELKLAQATHLRTSGGNAERTARFVRSLLQ